MGPEATPRQHVHQRHAAVTYRQNALRDCHRKVAEATYRLSLTPDVDASCRRIRA